MTKNTTTNNVDYFHPLYLEHEHQWKLCQDLYNGIDSSLKYLIQSTNENDEDFKVRQRLATLTPMFERVVTAQVGQVFRKPISYTDVPDKMKQWIEDELHFDTFIREATTNAIRDGKSFVFIDLPEDGGELLAIHVNRNQLINWRKDQHGNFTMAVIAELYEVEEEFKVSYETQYRHIDPNGNHSIYRKEGGDWKLYRFIETAFPFVPLYEADLGSVPPNYDIAVMNRVEFNSCSMTANAIRKATDPSLLTIGLGLDDGAEVKLGVNATINTDNPEADVRWVELNGASIPIAKEDIKDQRHAMAERALTLQNSSLSTKTATQVNKESAESNARLTDISTEMQVLANNIYQAIYRVRFNQDAVGTIELPFDFNDDAGDTNIIAQLNQLYVSGAISQETLLNTLREKEMLLVDDVAEEIKRTQEEGLPIETTPQVPSTSKK